LKLFLKEKIKNELNMNECINNFMNKIKRKIKQKEYDVDLSELDVFNDKN